MKCSNCKKEIRVKPSRISKHNYCSRDCFYKGNKVNKRNLKSLVGKTFNMLTVIKEGGGKTYAGDKKVRTWIVECKCGNKKEIPTQNLGITKSCGCIMLKPTHSWMYNSDRVDAVVKQLFRSYKNGAVKRGLTFEIPFNIFKILVQSDCNYCEGVTPLKTRYKTDSKVKIIGVDRKNNDIGYTINNSVPCCPVCNYMKRKYDIEFFINHINKIYNANNK